MLSYIVHDPIHQSSEFCSGGNQRHQFEQYAPIFKYVSITPNILMHVYKNILNMSPILFTLAK